MRSRPSGAEDVSSRLVSVAVTVLFIGAAAWLIREGQAYVPSVDQIAWVHVGPLVLAALAYAVFQGLLLRDILVPDGIALRYPEHFGCSVVTTLWNYIFPFSGFAFRGIYLRKVHDMDYTRFIGSTSALFIAEILVFSGLGLLCIGLIGFSMLETGYVTLAVLGVAFLASLVVCLFRIRVPGFLGTPGRKVDGVLQGIHGLLAKPAVFLVAAGWTSAIFVSYAAMYFFAARMIGLDLPSLASGVFSAITDLALLFRIAPAAAGTFDASVMYVGTEFGLNLTQGLLLAFMVRLSQLVVAFTAGVWFHFALSRRMAAKAAGGAA